MFARLGVTSLEVICENGVPRASLSLGQLWVRVRTGASQLYLTIVLPWGTIKLQTFHRVFNVNQTMKSNFFFSCVL